MVPTTNAWRIEFDMMDTTTALGKMRATDGIKNRFTKISTNCNCCDNLEFSRFGGNRTARRNIGCTRGIFPQFCRAKNDVKLCCSYVPSSIMRLWGAFGRLCF
jgi:hypothetical protein